MEGRFSSMKKACQGELLTGMSWCDMFQGIKQKAMKSILKSSLKLHVGILCLLLLSLCSFLTCSRITVSPPKPVKGILDLHNWSLHDQGPVSLAGEWQGIEPGSGYLMLERVDISQASRYSRGNTIMARLKIINNRTDDSAILLYTHASHLRILVNGKEYVAVPDYRMGVLESRYPVVLPFRALADDKIDLFITDDGLFEFRCLVGDRENLSSRREMAVAVEFFIITLLVLNGLYHVFIAFYRRLDLTAMWFGLLSFIFAFRASIKNEKIFISFFPSIKPENIIKMDYLVMLSILPVFLFFYRRFYPGRVRSVFVRSVAVLCVLYALLTVFTSSVVFRSMLGVFEGVILLTGVYLFLISLKEAMSGDRKAYLGTAGITIFLMTIINDIFHAAGIITTFHMTSLGLLAYIGLIALDLSMRSLDAFDQVTRLTGNLENEVEKRTGELQKERDLLHEKNVMIQKEFELAWQIQKELIPLAAPVDYIYTLYKPLQSIGGDFFDFLRFRNSDRIGLFLSDVSGHGVPAALVTSMVKTIVLQSGPRREEPAELMRYLNSILTGKIGGNFVTALYVIYDPHTHELVYSNAGHYFPVVIDNGGTRPLQGIRGVPLAIFDNEYLDSRGKGYGTSMTVLPEKSKLLLYTDGLIEATNVNDASIYFEDAGFHDILYSLRDRPCRDFMDELYRQFLKFRGSECFEDDVCVICLDVM